MYFFLEKIGCFGFGDAHKQNNTPMSTARPSRDRHAPKPFEAGQGGGLASSKDTQTTASPADGKDPGATPTPSATSTSTSSKAKKKRQVLSPEDKQAKKKIAMEAKKRNENFIRVDGPLWAVRLCLVYPDLNLINLRVLCGFDRGGAKTQFPLAFRPLRRKRLEWGAARTQVS